MVGVPGEMKGADEKGEGAPSNTAIYSPKASASLHPVRSLRSISRSEFAECPWLEPVHPVF